MLHRIKRIVMSLAVASLLGSAAAAVAPLRAQGLYPDERAQSDQQDRLAPIDGEDRLDRLDDDAADSRGRKSRKRAAKGLRGTVDDQQATGGKTTDLLIQDPLPVKIEPKREPLKALAVDEDPVLETVEPDPYAAIGVRFGSFLLFPELAAETVYHDNIFLSPTLPEGDWALELTPRLAVRSDWNRHSLEGNISGVRSFHDRFATEDDKTFSADVTGQLDIRRDTNVVASAGFSEALEDRSSVDFPTNAAERAVTRTSDASLEGNHTLNRVTLTLRGDVSQEAFDNSTAVDGSVIDNAQRDYSEHRLTGRVAYEFQPGVQAFVEASTNDRDFEREIDANGILNGSSGHDVQAGLAFRLTGKLTGEASAGYALQTPDDSSLENVDGLIFNAALEYKATALTTFRLDAASEIAETTQAGTAGSIARSAVVSVDHRPRRNIILGASLGYENEQFSGTDTTDEDWVTGLTGEYLFSPSVGLIVSYEHGESLSSTPGSDYSTDEVRMGVRFRR